MIEEHASPSPAPEKSQNAFYFTPPGGQRDFVNVFKQAELEDRWSTHLDGFTQQAILGNPWSALNVPVATNYFNPIPLPIDTNPSFKQINWPPFPGRISFYNPNLSTDDLLSLADTGYDTKHQSFPIITKDPCSGKPAKLDYGPYGPRGWQDEYCEWCITRNAAGKITRIDLTCENPEYWNTLWDVDPTMVLKLYQDTLGKPQIQQADLELPVTDPYTGRKAYNPLNKWNTGTVSNATQGGAMHLTSTPNTIQTEMGLAATATPQRTIGHDKDLLICCGQYGQPHRNSDPTIGATVNGLVAMGNSVTLSNPPGLYIQPPSDWSIFQTWDPSVKAEQFWKVVRGTDTLTDPMSKKVLPGHFILHAVFEVPESTGHTIEDISIRTSDGKGNFNMVPITYGGQFVQTLLMQIVATRMPAPAPTPIACVINLPDSSIPTQPQPQPMQLFYAEVFEQMAKTIVPNPVGVGMTLLSNSTMIAPKIAKGKSLNMTLIVYSPAIAITDGNLNSDLTIRFGNGELITATQGTGVKAVKYAVPGNTYPDNYYAVPVTVTVDASVSSGLKSCTISNKQSGGGTYAMPALLHVI